MKHAIDLGHLPQLVRCNLGNNHVGSIHYRIDEWWSLLLINYEAQAELDERPYQLKQGTVILVPPHVEKHYQCDRSARHYFAHFRLRNSKQHSYHMPECFDTGDHYQFLCDTFHIMINAHAQQHQHAASIHLWHLLQRLADDFARIEDNNQVHPAAQQALEIIEAELSQNLQLPEIAERVKVSSNYLNAIFKQHFGETVYAYIVRLRMDRAHYLLAHSDLKIQAIAAELGITDLQAFNKLVRKHLGKSPRKIRESILH